jgi:ABC-type Fe3+-siderophore transport system permease subunit
MGVLQLTLMFWIITSAVSGAAIYTIAAFKKHRKVEIEDLLTGAAASALLPAGIDLIICAYNPAHLIAKIAEDGKTVYYTGVIVIGDLHRLDITIAGLALIYLGIAGLLVVCRK